MVQHSKNERSCGCGGKTKTAQQTEPDFTLVSTGSGLSEAAGCGDCAGHEPSADGGCCGSSQAKQPAAKASIAPRAGSCCGGHGHR